MTWCALVLVCLVAAQRLAAQDSVIVPVPAAGRIVADAYGSGARGVVVIGHGGYSTRQSWAGVARELASSGYRVLVMETRAAVDLRNGAETACLYDAPCMATDVLAAVRYLRATGARTVAVIGGSAGGGAAAQAAVDAPGDIDRLVLLAPMAIDAPERVVGRKLILVARGDFSGSGPRLPEIRRQVGRMPKPKELVILEGSAHGQRLFDTRDAARILRLVRQFLDSP